ncbi:MAG: hypothetical protein H0V96_11000 [Acidimicrobiia bacterium]|nr:hypothetical protein [Acidimicrobiia bacterium]
MHIGRVVALLGVVIGVIGLFLKALTSPGESVLEALSESVETMPAGLPTIWGGLDTWAQVAVVVAILIVLALVFQPPRDQSFTKAGAGIVTLIGVALTAYAVTKWLEAGDNADALSAGFEQVFDAGGIPEAFDVATGPGFIVLIVGTLLVTIGGLLGLRTRTDTGTAAPPSRS